MKTRDAIASKILFSKNIVKMVDLVSVFHGFPVALTEESSFIGNFCRSFIGNFIRSFIGNFVGSVDGVGVGIGVDAVGVGVYVPGVAAPPGSANQSPVRGHHHLTTRRHLGESRSQPHLRGPPGVVPSWQA